MESESSIILAEPHGSFTGIEIESEYRPAREAGGDFFQIIPNENDDSLLIVAGDVAGKGLQAGMLVSLRAQFEALPTGVLIRL